MTNEEIITAVLDAHAKVFKKKPLAKGKDEIKRLILEECADFNKSNIKNIVRKTIYNYLKLVALHRNELGYDYAEEITKIINKEC